ncbi:MAG TPA: DoxX family protein [Chitinophagales bacterium]|nr:DoxX family protein [Chitinophagales bacterium]
MTTIQQISLYVMVAFYAFAGFNHFKNPKFYEGIIPSFMPDPSMLNQVSGVAEIILAISLLFASTRPISAYLIIAMLIVFFAVHIAHLFNPPKMAQGKEWFLYLRIPLQFVLIYWAWCVGKY